MFNVSFHTAYLIAALATFAVELAAVWVVLRVKKRGAAPGRIVGAVFLANAATHPLLWYIPYLFFPSAFSPGIIDIYTVSAELLVFVVEAAIYWFVLAGRNAWTALALSAIANALSLGFGFILGKIFSLTGQTIML